MSSTAPSTPVDPHVDERIEPYVWRITAVVILGMMMSILDTTIVNVALHTISVDLHATKAEVQWIVTGYLIALGAVIPVTGWAARRFGPKRVYMVSLVLFTLGSAACGLSTTLPELVLFRVLQGVGGGMLLPVVMIIMASIAGPRRMGRVMAVVSMPMMLGPIFGPVIGGLILQNLHWSWIFFVNVPIGVIAFVLGARMIPHLDSGEAGKLDILGLALLPAGVAAIIYGVSEVATPGAAIGSVDVLLPIVAGVALVVAFCVHALRAQRPLLDIRLYANRVFAGASLTTFFVASALFGAMILVPFYYQEVRHESVVVTGLLNGPQGLGALVAMPIANRLTERFGGGRVTLAGVSVLCASTVPLAFIGAYTSILAISLILVVRGVSIGLCFMPAMTAAFGALRPEQISDATPQLNVLQRVGGAIGTAVLAVVLQRALTGAHTPEAMAHAYGTAYWFGL
ncbi:MAG TPA: DHA2 family efflux MFS transporter permease subunit, partial [Candidatus Eremiobacteraceae bacterium]|nr:DHA2 family efflux MFS transporter permease subunit [Candidatus Eremiobacteraceae bacterium]